MTKLRSIILLTVLMVSVNIIHAINDMPIIAAFQGEHHNSSYGYSMVSLDFNHDGNDDLVVCSYSFGYEYGESPSKG